MSCTVHSVEIRPETYDFELPEGRIARYPAERRDASRLLGVDPGEDRIWEIGTFADFPTRLADGDLLVLNDARVFKARLVGRRKSGGRVEALLLSLAARPVRSLLRPLTRIKDGETIDFGGFPGRLVARHADGTVEIDFGAASPADVAACAGEVPIPPYLKRPAEAVDAERYQTVYAASSGAAAAPTAGLHFTPELLETIRARSCEVAYLTLEVGYGTFAPVELTALRLHAEAYRIPAETLARIEETKARGGRVVAVGTTVVRTLETWGRTGVAQGETDIFIKPGFPFRVVDTLLTNFHLPGSSLLVLAHAFAGDILFRAYRHAIENAYRFFSYGDAMFIEGRAR